MLQKYKYIFGIVYNIFSDSLSKQDGRKKGKKTSGFSLCNGRRRGHIASLRGWSVKE
jgi:hypothetical protein